MLRTHRALRLAALAAFTALLALHPAQALSYVSIQAGRVGLGNPGTIGEVSPVLLTVFGASLPVIEKGPFRFEPTLLIWGTPYQYASSVARAVPTQIETADQFMALGVWIAPLAGVHFTAYSGKHGSLELGAAATVALNLRVPMLPHDNGAAYLADAARYFYGKARFLFPETDAWVKWHFEDNMSVSLTVKALYPVFHLWDGDGAGFADQLFLGATFGLEIRPRRTPAAAPAQGGATVESEAPAPAEEPASPPSP